MECSHGDSELFGLFDKMAQRHKDIGVSQVAFGVEFLGGRPMLPSTLVEGLSSRLVECDQGDEEIVRVEATEECTIEATPPLHTRAPTNNT